MKKLVLYGNLVLSGLVLMALLSVPAVFFHDKGEARIMWVGK